VKLATPELFNGTIANVVPSFMNVTVPLGVPFCDFTIAVSVTAAPVVTSEDDTVRAVVVSGGLTITCTEGEVEAVTHGVPG